MFPHFIYGGDYNPDQWPEEIWQKDVRLMREAGVNLVSLGIFSWAKIEPKQGKYDFEWLDKIINLLFDYGISVNLATPTASPPPWMVKAHPEILPVTSDGTTLWHGSRRHYCPHNKKYRKYAVRIAEKLAERYKDHPSLAMWHIDNEYGCHFSECFCDTSVIAFRKWLKLRYSSLDNLNYSWGTAFWSQQYSGWGEIQPPKKAPAFVNPGQQLDWKRFCSDSWISCFEDQKKVIKEITPNIPVTTNFMGFFKGIDYWKFADHEDIVSNDNYPDVSEEGWMAKATAACDLVRSLKEGSPWLLMEQAVSHVNWRQRNSVKRPGIMRLGSLQAVARGAEGIMFFQWRASKAGAEKHHSAMLPHAGTDSRTWNEVKSLGNELKNLDRVLSSRVQADVAILLDWENWWALELDSKPSNDISLLPQILSYYIPLFKRNITVDFIHPEYNLSRYKLIIAPNMYMTTKDGANNIKYFVENGGHLIMTFFSGIVDENEQVYTGGYPAPFREMLGLGVEEYSPFVENEINYLLTNKNERFSCSLWADVIRLQGAEPLAAFEQDYYKGKAAVTRHKYGKGISYYIGTQPDENGIDWLLSIACREAGVSPVMKDIPLGVEAVKRSNDDLSWLFLLNHSDKRVEVPLELVGRDILTDKIVNDIIYLDPLDVCVIEIDEKNK